MIFPFLEYPLIIIHEVINQAHVTPLPVTPTIIQAVEAIAAAQGQKGLRIKTRRGGTLFDSSWTAGVEYDDDEEESDYEYDSDDDTTTTDEFSYDSEDSDSDDEMEANELLNEDHHQSTGVAENPEQDTVHDEDPVEMEDSEQPPPLRAPPQRKSTRERTQMKFMQPSMKGYPTHTLHHKCI